MIECEDGFVYAPYPSAAAYSRIQRIIDSMSGDGPPPERVHSLASSRQYVEEIRARNNAGDIIDAFQCGAINTREVVGQLVGCGLAQHEIDLLVEGTGGDGTSIWSTDIRLRRSRGWNRSK